MVKFIPQKTEVVIFVNYQGKIAAILSDGRVAYPEYEFTPQIGWECEVFIRETEYEPVLSLKRVVSFPEDRKRQLEELAQDEQVKPEQKVEFAKFYLFKASREEAQTAVRHTRKIVSRWYYEPPVLRVQWDRGPGHKGTYHETPCGLVAIFCRYNEKVPGEVPLIVWGAITSQLGQPVRCPMHLQPGHLCSSCHECHDRDGMGNFPPNFEPIEDYEKLYELFPR